MLLALTLMWSYRVGIFRAPVRSNPLGPVVTKAESTLPVKCLKAWLRGVLVHRAGLADFL